MTDQQPELHRSGKRTLMLCGAIGKTHVWRDVTEQVNFANSKHKPHQGRRERARRLRQAQRILDKRAAIGPVPQSLGTRFR